MYIALIGDMVSSRELGFDKRRKAQRELEEVLDDINNHEHLSKHIISNFVITTGDEFQGLLSDEANPLMYVRFVKSRMENIVAFRFGVGRGELTTPPKDIAVGMDGKCFYRAREAIEDAEDEQLDVLTSGYYIEGKNEKIYISPTINLLLKNFFYLHNRFTDRQRKIYDLRYSWGKSISDIQEEFGYSNSSSIYTELAKEQMKLAIEIEIALSDLFENRDPSLSHTDINLYILNILLD